MNLNPRCIGNCGRTIPVTETMCAPCLVALESSHTPHFPDAETRLEVMRDPALPETRFVPFWEMAIA